MNVAITGASGYIGRALADAFTKRGHHVLRFCRRECPPSWHPYSLGGDPDQLPWDGVDALVHAAYDFSAYSRQEILERNVHPSIRLLDSAVRHNVGKLLLVSSLSSFPEATSAYGKAKLAIEDHITRLGGQVVRPGLVWSEEPGGIVGAMGALMRKIPVIPYPQGGPNNKQFLIHRDDLANSLVNLLEISEPLPGIISMAHPQPWTIREILDAVAVRHRIPCRPIPLPWQLLHAPLKAIECCGLRSRLRSDSLWGLVHGNSNPPLDPLPGGITPRPFA